jgi:hypothetical protein
VRTFFTAIRETSKRVLDLRILDIFVGFFHQSALCISPFAVGSSLQSFVDIVVANKSVWYAAAASGFRRRPRWRTRKVWVAAADWILDKGSCEEHRFHEALSIRSCALATFEIIRLFEPSAQRFLSTVAVQSISTSQESNPRLWDCEDPSRK